MAFGNNMFGGYQAPFYPMPDFRQPVQQITTQVQTTSNNGIIPVANIGEVQGYYIAPGQTGRFIDQNSMNMYLKTADMSGNATIRIFDILERKTDSMAVSDDISGGSEELKKLQSDYNTLNSRVDELYARIDDLLKEDKQ